MAKWEQVKNVLAGASELPPGERGAYLDAACRGDAALRAEVEALLKSHDEAGPFLSAPTMGVEASSAPTAMSPGSGAAGRAADGGGVAGGPMGEHEGTRIGPYRLLQLIGEGGFGSVFMAEQEKPVSRKVALKIIKLGMDTHQVVARFEQERQALAMMDHPNIARVLDAGATDTGRPYFVMDLVKGDPIVEYCDKNSLSIEERLELFAQVCTAVQHAHTKGIIHRDIKPSNILVSTQDGRPNTKVIDFGIAKATASKLTEKTLFTEHKALIGTPEYMSPEQAEGSLDIDTRTDVYSLGVLLYELLTGTTPFGSKELRSAAYAEIQRIIREVEPPKPSTRISQNTDTIASIATKRHTEPKRLGTIVRGELDWIVMKALEKDRQRRYETANGLGMDIKRYLAGEAVVAAPASKAYRFKKFVKRNKGPVVAAGFVAAALVLGVIGTGIGLLRAERARAGEVEQRQEADRQAEIARTNEKEAKDRESETAAVLKFVEDRVFAAARPKGQEGGQGYEVKLADAITAAVPYVEKSFIDQPLIEARLRRTLGISFTFLGKADVAEQQYRRAREIYTAKLGPDHPDTIVSMTNLANGYADLGRHPEALALREEALKLQKAKLGPDHPETLKSMNNLANSYADLGRHPEALALHEETLTLMKARLGPDHPDALKSMNNLAISYAALGRHPEALALYEETLKLRKAKLGPDHPDTLMSMNNLAFSYAALGRHPEALALREETLTLMKARLGPDHPDALKSMNNLASSYADLGRHPEALALHEETFKLMKAKLGPDHPDTLRSMTGLANTYVALGRHPEALALREETLKLRKAKLGPDHPDTVWAIYNIACSHALMIAKAEDRGKQADLAMDWLQQAVAAGFKDAVHMQKDTDLNPLREREDFKKLIAELEAKTADEKKP